MKKMIFLFPVIVSAVLGGYAHAGGKFGGGSGGGFAAASASGGLGGPALALGLPADQVMERTWGAIAANTLTITDGSPAAITAGGDIRLTIPSALGFTWAASVTAPVFGGSAVGKVGASVSYENGGKTAVIDVTSDFAASDTLTVSGLFFTNLVRACMAERLQLDVQNDGKPDAWSDKAVAVTVSRPGGFGDGGDGYTMTQDKPLFVLPYTLIMIR